MDEGRPMSAGEVAEQIRRLTLEVRRTKTLDAMRPLFYEADRAARNFPDDVEIQSLLQQFKQVVAAHGAAIQQGMTGQAPASGAAPGATQPTPAPGTMRSQQIPTRDVGAAVRTPSGELPIHPAVTGPPPEPARPTPPAKPVSKSYPAIKTVAGKKRPSKAPVIAAAAAAGVLAAGLIFYILLKKEPGGGTREIAVDFVTNPPGASIRVDHQLKGNSNCKVSLEPGEHKLEAVLDGYEPHVATIMVSEGQPAEVKIDLVARPQTVRFFTDLRTGSVVLDGQPAGELQDGQIVLESVRPGAHTVAVRGGACEVSFPFTLTPGKAPELTGPISAKNILAVVFSNFGGNVFARTSSPPIQIHLDGRSSGQIGPDGLTMSEVAPGDHEVQIGGAGTQQKMVVSFGAAPTLTAFLKLDQDAGTLVVVTGENDAVVLLNGKPMSRKTRDGQLRIPLLPVRQYTVKVQKDGYEAVAEQNVAIRKGEESRVVFQLRPVPQLAALRIRGGAAGTTVILDQTQIGTIGADGTLAHSGINPGDHTIELRRDKHQPKRLQRRFAAGEALELSDADAALEKLPGVVRVTVSPPNSTVSVRRPGQRQGRQTQENPITLADGQWIVTATHPELGEKSATVTVSAGETTSVDLALSKETRPAPPVKLGMEAWEQPGAWQRDGSWLARQGGEFVPFGASPTHGTFVFTATMLKGKRLYWFVNRTDARNYLLMELERREYSRSLVTNGRSKEMVKKKHGLEDENIYTLSVEITPGSLVTRVYAGGIWRELDSWQTQEMNLTQGKFGFRIPGSDRLGLSNFSFVGK